MTAPLSRKNTTMRCHLTHNKHNHSEPYTPESIGLRCEICARPIYCDESYGMSRMTYHLRCSYGRKPRPDYLPSVRKVSK